MKNPTHGLLIAALSALALVSGCYVQSLHPFYTDETKIPIPENILGHWNLVRENDRDMTENYPEAWKFSEEEIICYDVGVMANLKSVFFEVDGVLFLDVQAGSSSGNGWLNVHLLSVHQAYKVETNENEMAIIPLDYKWLREQTQTGALRVAHFIPEPDDKYSSVLLTDKPERLAELMKICATNSAAFSEVRYTFRKLEIETATAEKGW